MINGDPGTHISALDRGLQYGDGLFETIAVAGSHPCLWERHYRRLQEGGRRLGIPIPDAEILINEIAKEIGSNDKGVIKVIITRGEGGRGYYPPQDPVVTRIVRFFPWQDYPSDIISQGVHVRICNTRLGINHSLAGIKHLNRLEQVLARNEWQDTEFREGLMLDTYDRVIEGTMSNVFLCKGGRLFTPDLSESGVCGVVRELVLDVAAERGVQVNIERVGLTEVLQADSMFLTNSLIGIWPVKVLQDREYDLTTLDHEFISEVMSRAYV